MMMPIKHAARFLNGAAFKPSDWGDTGLPILRIAQLTGKPFDNYFDGTINRGLLIRDGDLLFSWSATIDAFIWDRGDAILNQHIFKVFPKNNALKKYLFYVIKAHAPRWADDDAHGSTMRHIKKESLSNKVWIPDLETQKAIADFLDCETARIGRLIETKQRLVALLGEKRSALISAAVTGGIDPLSGQYRTPEADGGVTNRVPIKHLFDVSRRMVLPTDFGNEPLFHYSLPAWHEHGDGIVENATDMASGKLLLDGGEILVSKLNPEKGAVLLAEHHEIPTVCSPEFIALIPRAIDRRFAYFFMLSAPLRHQLNASVESVTNSHKRARVDRFLASKIELPNPETQKAIADFLDRETARIGQIIDKTQQSIVLLHERRTSLITAAVTGQMDVTALGWATANRPSAAPAPSARSSGAPQTG